MSRRHTVKVDDVEICMAGYLRKRKGFRDVKWRNKDVFTEEKERENVFSKKSKDGVPKEART